MMSRDCGLGNERRFVAAFGHWSKQFVASSVGTKSKESGSGLGGYSSSGSKEDGSDSVTVKDT